MNYYNRDGQPVDRETWHEEWARKNREIDTTTIRRKGDYIHVWTTWNGVDMDIKGVSEAPLIYQTTVLGRGNDDRYERLYATEAEAREGHQEILESYGYPPEKGLRRYRGWRRVADMLRSIWDSILYPRSMKDAVIFFAMWTLVLAGPIVSASLGPFRPGSFFPSWSNLIVLAFDAVMFSASLHGLMWASRNKRVSKAPSDA